MRSPVVEPSDSPHHHHHQLQPDSTAHYCSPSSRRIIEATTITSRQQQKRDNDDNNCDINDVADCKSSEQCRARRNPPINGGDVTIIDVQEAGENDREPREVASDDSLVVLVRSNVEEGGGSTVLVNNNNTIVAETDTSTDEEETDDDDGDEEEDEEDVKKHGWLTSNDQMPANQQLQREMNGIALPTSSDPSTYGDISFTNCSTVQVGPRTFYKGPVTIKQFVYRNSSPVGGVDQDKISACSDNGDAGGGLRRGLTYQNANGAKLSQSSDRPLCPGTSERVAEWCSLKRCLISVGAAVFILLLIIVLSIVLALSSASSSPVPTIPGVHVVKRIEWGAQPAKIPANPLAIDPPPYIIISHTATEFCYTQSQCVLIVRVAQTFHMESRGWDDIGYNFLVGGDGLVYEGRGWGVEGAHTFNYNVRSIGISFIGTFNEVEPTQAQLHAAKKLIEFAQDNGYVSKDYKLLGHRQCIKTESPGNKVYNIIKTWKHWSPTPE